jgi:two-component system, OmpR family, response regulator
LGRFSATEARKENHMRVLVVEDEASIAESIAAVLRARGDSVDVADDGVEAVELAVAYRYEAILLDVNLPGLDGFAVCRSLRAKGEDASILMLTARDGLEDRLIGLNCGADDYLAKPFAMEELLARLLALRRRQHGQASPLLRVGELALDPAALEVRVGSREVRMSAREFAVLEVLVRHRGQVLSRDQLIEAVWGPDFEAESNLVEVYIRGIRKKLDEQDSQAWIETIRGAGYRLKCRATEC